MFSDHFRVKHRQQLCSRHVNTNIETSVNLTTVKVSQFLLAKEIPIQHNNNGSCI